MKKLLLSIALAGAAVMLITSCSNGKKTCDRCAGLDSKTCTALEAAGDTVKNLADSTAKAVGGKIDKVKDAASKAADKVRDMVD